MFDKSIVSSRKIQVFSILVVLTLIWGSSFILIKKAIDGLTFWQLGSLRIVIAGLIMMPVAVLKWDEIPKDQLLKIGISGLLGNFLPSFLFGLALLGLSSSVAGILNSLTPIWVLLTSRVFFSIAFKGGQILGTVLGFLGALILILLRKSGELSFNLYGLFAIAGTLCYGLNINYIKKNLSHVPSLLLSSISLSLVFWPALILLIFNDFLSIFATEKTNSLLAVLLLSIFSTALGLVLFNKFIKMVSPILASSVTYLIPIVSVLWGVFDGEPFTWLHIFGMFMVFLGIILLVKDR